MKNFNTTKKIILITMLASVISPTAEAVYESRSDTGTAIFDYIENRRREERANALTREQKRLLKDIEETKNRMPKEIDADKPAPAAFEGDDMVYNVVTGEFKATGKVDIIQIEGYRFQSDEASGNIHNQEIHIQNKAHMLQLKPDAPRVTLDGYNAVYNYGTKMGTMDKAKGKAGEYYISGKRFEFYPDHIVVYEGTQTKCNAHNPDYHLSAERMEIWPEQIVRMNNVRMWIKNQVVGKREYMERRLDESEENYFPQVGYDSDSGAYIEDTFEFPFVKHLVGVINAHIESKKGIRSNAEIHYTNRELAVRGLYGFYRDDNSKYIQKEPSLDIYFSKHFGKSPYYYSLEYEVGHWVGTNARSLHQEFEIGLGRNPIVLPGRYVLFVHTSYKITKDKVKRPNRGDTRVNGFNYDLVLAKEFDDRFAAFTAYHYTKNNSKNSLFDFNVDDYSQKFETGLSYRLTEKDRVVLGFKFDTEEGKLADADYYWFHDFHCSTAILRWRDKRNKLEAHWEFTPW